MFQEKAQGGALQRPDPSLKEQGTLACLLGTYPGTYSPRPDVQGVCETDLRQGGVEGVCAA